jgi:hypothetical protein
MPLPNYLQETKNGWFRYRRPIPVDLRGFIKKKVYIACLHTRDLNTAKVASQQESVDFNAMIEKARGSLSRRSQQLLRSADIDMLANRFEALLLFSDEDERSQKLDKLEIETHKALIREGAQETKDAFYAQDASPYVEDYLSFAETEGMRINPKWSHFERFALGMLSAQARAYSALEARLSGMVIPTPEVAPRVRSEEDLDDINRLLDFWEKRNKPKSKSVTEARSTAARARQFANVTRVSQMNVEFPARFREWLRTEGGLQGVKPGKRGNPLRMATVKKCIRLLSSAIQCAVEDKRLKVNPLAALKFPPANDSIERLSFGVEQLNEIFNSPVFTQGYRPVGGAGEAAFWLPLFGLLGGGRETEHGQPLLTDIGCENGIYYIEVTEETAPTTTPDAAESPISLKNPQIPPNKSIKTPGSRRRIPIHSTLIKIGFLDYVKWLKDRGEVVLFPMLRADCHGTLLGNWSKWWNRYLDNVVGIDQRGLDYHSLRHTFKYFGHSSKMEEPVLDRLQGHQPGHVGGKYGGFYPVQRLSEELEKLDIPGLVLSHLRWTPPTGAEPRRMPRRPGGKAVC